MEETFAITVGTNYDVSIVKDNCVFILIKRMHSISAAIMINGPRSLLCASALQCRQV